MDRQTRYPKEVRERAVRLVFEHEREYTSQWAAISSIASEARDDARDAAQVGASGRDRRGPAPAASRPPSASA